MSVSFSGEKYAVNSYFKHNLTATWQKVHIFKRMGYPLVVIFFDPHEIQPDYLILDEKTNPRI